MSTEAIARPLARACREAAVVAALAACAGLAFNAARPGGLPLVATAPYETMVPCPEPGGEVAAVEPGEVRAAGGSTLLIDARDAGAFAGGAVPGALNVPYDWLDPTPEESLRALARSVAATGARRVVVYGDGGRPDSGEHLARELSGRGIKNVSFVRGGAPALLRNPLPRSRERGRPRPRGDPAWWSPGRRGRRPSLALSRSGVSRASWGLLRGGQG
jgi:3-mercaptopyruvate sulfurtransferase SseA